MPQRESSAAEESSDAEQVDRAFLERVAALRQQYRCTMPTRCAEHARLVHDATGVTIDAPAVVECAARAMPDLRRAHGRFVDWVYEVAAEFKRTQARFEDLVRAAPADANYPETLAGLVGALRDWIALTERYGLRFGERWTLTVSGSLHGWIHRTSNDDLARAAGVVAEWLRDRAPTATKRRQVIAAILVHHGWEITGTTLTDKAAALAKLIERRRRGKQAR